MAKSKKRGGAKAHKCRVAKRNKSIEVKKAAAKKKFMAEIRKSIEAQRKQDDEAAAIEEANEAAAVEAEAENAEAETSKSEVEDA